MKQDLCVRDNFLNATNDSRVKEKQNIALFYTLYKVVAFNVQFEHSGILQSVAEVVCTMSYFNGKLIVNVRHLLQGCAVAASLM